MLEAFIPKTISAQSEKEDLLTVYGEILNGKKSDIMVFRQVDNDWDIIRMMRSRSKYSLNLNLNYRHYVVFRRKDGLVRAIYVNQSSSGCFKMNFDVAFDDFNTDYIVLYKNRNDNYFSSKVIKKRNQKIQININSENLVIAQ